MKLIKTISVATFALMLGTWSTVSRSEDYSEQDELANSSPASLFYATATFTDGSGNNQNDFAQSIGISPGSNTQADGYIVDPVNNQVNLKFSIYNGQSSFGYKSGNIQIYWNTIPAGYSSASAFMKAVKVSGTKAAEKSIITVFMSGPQKKPSSQEKLPRSCFSSRCIRLTELRSRRLAPMAKGRIHPQYRY